MLNRIKQTFWRMIYPIFSPSQKLLLRLGVVRHESGRQRYHIGWLRNGATLKEMKKHLSEKWGFGNHFVAWHDEDQVLSWRRLANFNEQWHLRVYIDGEIRGHYEKTPEANPIDHFMEIGEIDRAGDFVKFLGEYCVQDKSAMRLIPDPDMTDPLSEITVASLSKI